MDSKTPASPAYLASSSAAVLAPRPFTFRPWAGAASASICVCGRRQSDDARRSLVPVNAPERADSMVESELRARAGLDRTPRAPIRLTLCDKVSKIALPPPLRNRHPRRLPSSLCGTAARQSLSWPFRARWVRFWKAHTRFMGWAVSNVVTKNVRDVESRCLRFSAEAVHRHRTVGVCSRPCTAGGAFVPALTLLECLIRAICAIQLI